MPYTADDCSELCWPRGSGFLPEDHPNHAECEKRLMDFSGQCRHDLHYCACDCHYRPELPGFRLRTSGRGVTRAEADPSKTGDTLEIATEHMGKAKKGN